MTLLMLLSACQVVLGIESVQSGERPPDGSVGAPAAEDAVSVGSRVPDPVVLYLFDEGGGDVVRDQSGEPAIDLNISNPDAVRWEPGTMRLVGETTILSPTPPDRLVTALQATQALTIEAWLTADAAALNGPRRIVALSEDSLHQSFVLAQGANSLTNERDMYAFRLRTSTQTSDQGTPALETEDGSATAALSHVVFTREPSGTVRAYIDGEPVLSAQRDGDFSLWDPAHRLGLGNEQTGERVWPGVLHLVAIYDRALDEDEVMANFLAGEDPERSAGE